MKKSPRKPEEDLLKIALTRHDLGQLLDGLRIRAESWSKTADYLEEGCSSDDCFICEECSDAEEARSVARHYERIIAEIESQMERQEKDPEFA